MRIHVVDGSFELFRAHYSKRPTHLSPDGRDVKATVGTIASMLALVHDESQRVTHLLVTFDDPVHCFRNDLFDGYKTWELVEPALVAQLRTASDALRAMGIAVWDAKDLEADDGMATCAARFADAAEQVLLLSPDKDLAQCIRGERVVTVDRIRDRVVDEAALLASRGVAPESIPDYLALVGDTADGIPGLAGFGEKSAATLLRRWKHLDAIPSDASAWDVTLRGRDQLATTLREHREDALLFRTLATLRTDAPIPSTLDELAFAGIDRNGFGTVCDDLGVTTLRDRPTRWR